MSVLGGRGGRPDDWATQHARAQTRAAERLAGPLDDAESSWLDDHLAACADCSAVAAEYATERLQLRALRDRQPPPPRDLWARTAAAIEREAGTGRRRRRRSARALLAPYAVLASALVVAVVYGSLSSSQGPARPSAASPRPSGPVAIASQAPSAGPTPLIVTPRDVAYLSSEGDGYNLNTTRVDRVCPAEAASCATSEPNEVVEIGPLSSPATVFGSEAGPLVIVGDDGTGASVFILDLDGPTTSPSGSPPPTTAPTPGATAVTTARPMSSPTGSVDPTIAPSATPPASASPSPSVSIDPTATPDGGTIEIARDVEVVDTTAAYAPDGSAFAFTARPIDGSHGPDIYVWNVGDAAARPVTTDHRSVFGSWAGGSIAGSTVETIGDRNEPHAFVLEDLATEPVLHPEAGLVWRPVVDPTGGSAVYWSGTVEPTADGTGWLPADGRLVIGRWDSGEADREADAEAPTATALTGNQAEERSETTIADGPLTEWDVRWDETGERLAVWVADEDDPKVGRLSLYVVDPFDGRIDLASPPLVDEPALAGFSIADGRLAWASPAGDTAKSSRVLILAWTEDSFGQVESAAGDFILVR